MERDDIVRMARSAFDVHTDERGRVTFSGDHYCVEEFAALVAAHEREACEHIAMSEASSGSLYGWPECAYVIAKAIRARGDE